MVITREQFTKLMIEYGFARFPRAVGNPGQTIVHKVAGQNPFDTFIFFFKHNYARNPVFTSTNSYYDFNELGHPTNVYYEKMFFDLDIDTGEKIEIAHRDCKRLATFCIQYNMPFICSFSGNGFHFYMFFSPKVFTIDGKLSNKIKSVQSHIKHELKLKTVNLVCAEPKRLVRVPLSRYVTKKEDNGDWQVKNRHCIPLAYRQIMGSSMDEIMELSKKPVLLDAYKTNGKKISLKDFIRIHKVDMERKVTIEKVHSGDYSTSIDYTKYKDKDLYKMLKLLIPLPCLYKGLWDKNPPHYIRFSACAFLVDVLSRPEAHSLFDRLSHDAEWNDRQHIITRKYQINNIYNRGYNPYSCEDLARNGNCSEKCVRFNKVFKKPMSSDKHETRKS